MTMIIARATLLGLFAMGGSGAALANGDCGINSNKPCPPPKSSAKEPAYKSLNSNKPAAQRAAGANPSQVQDRESVAPAARASLAGISASDLKKPPASDCGINSNKPCADEAQASDPARVQADGDAETAKATLSGVNPNDLKLKPKSTSTFEKEPATKP